jgi:hypothetical protein
VKLLDRFPPERRIIVLQDAEVLIYRPSRFQVRTGQTDRTRSKVDVANSTSTKYSPLAVLRSSSAFGTSEAQVLRRF